MAYLASADPTAVVGRRLVAFLVDALIVTAVVLLALAIAEPRTFADMPSGACEFLREREGADTCVQLGSRVYTWEGGAAGGAALAGLVAAFANAVLLQGITGASVGKLALDLRVIDRTGSICGVGRAFARWVLLVFDLFACGLVGLITVSATRPHRRIGDLVAGTDVVASADVGSPVQPLPAYPPLPPPAAPAPVRAFGWEPPAAESSPAPESWWDPR